MVVAVDLMVVLHAALSAKGAKTCADQFWQEPLVPVTSVLDYFNDFYSALMHVSRDHLRVGRPAATPKGAHWGVPAAAEKHCRGPSKRALKRKTIYPRSNIIAVAVDWLRARAHVTVISAPFEADGQLVQEEWVGRADLVISVDSDLFPLGTEWLLTDLHRDSKGVWQCCTVKRALVLPQLELLVLGTDLVEQGYSLAAPGSLQELCTFLGTDYCPNLARWGLATVTTYFRKWTVMTDGEKNAELSRLQLVSKFNDSAIVMGYDILQYRTLWASSVCSFTHPPVFEEQYHVQDAVCFSAGSRSGDNFDPPASCDPGEGSSSQLCLRSLHHRQSTAEGSMRTCSGAVRGSAEPRNDCGV
jgi:hypothetical protein